MLIKYLNFPFDKIKQLNIEEKNYYFEKKTSAIFRLKDSSIEEFNFYSVVHEDKYEKSIEEIKEKGWCR